MPELPNSRKFFRLQYPTPELMPVLTINGIPFSVPEVSEKGLRILSNQFNAFQNRDLITGVIKFKDGEEMRVSGTVLRRDKDNYVLGEVSGLTQKRLMTEQRLVFNQKVKQ